MKIVAFALVLVLSGCTTYKNVHSGLPAPPPTLMEPCDELSLVPETDKMSVVVGTVLENYSKHHECAVKLHHFQQWYREQEKNLLVE